MQLSVHAFNQALEKSHLWLIELKKIGNLSSEEEAYTILHAVLHGLRDRLPVNEAVNLAAQLPMLIKGMYYEDWRPANVPEEIRTKKDFIEIIKNNFRKCTI